MYTNINTGLIQYVCINTICQCSVLQWSLLSLITVTGCSAVFNKVATGSKNTKQFMAKKCPEFYQIIL